LEVDTNVSEKHTTAIFRAEAAVLNNNIIILAAKRI
jgi:hypothetical protein